MFNKRLYNREYQNNPKRIEYLKKYRSLGEVKARQKDYRIKHKEKLNNYCNNYYLSHKGDEEKMRVRREYGKQWRRENKEKVKEYLIKTKLKRSKLRKNYYLKNKGKLLKNQKEYNKKNKERRNIYLREYSKEYFSLPKNHILKNLRERMRIAIIRSKQKKLKKTTELIGCPIDKLKKHLESQFKEGMSWENYGQWHIDHITPCIAFNLVDEEEQKRCFCYSNLQPLWAEENLKKGGKY